MSNNYFVSGTWASHVRMLQNAHHYRRFSGWMRDFEVALLAVILEYQAGRMSLAGLKYWSCRLLAVSLNSIKITSSRFLYHSR